jgi:hypothetical protein
MATEYVRMAHEQATGIKTLIDYGDQINAQEVLPKHKKLLMC